MEHIVTKAITEKNEKYENMQVEIAFDAMKNELENDKTYLSNDDAIRKYTSLFPLFCRIFAVKELLFELSKVYLLHGSNRQKFLSEIPKKSKRLKNCSV